MRIAIISDIHGNCLALDAVVADLGAQGIERIVCLGDAIQGGAQPAETVARLRALACPVVMGNADAWLLTGTDTGAEPVTERQLAVRAWSLSRLSDDDRAYIASFQPTITIALAAGLSLLCFHGSPGSFDDLIFPETPDAEAARLLGSPTAGLLCGGHTHRQQLRRLGAATFFNPGSVGLAYSNPQPADAPAGVLDVEPWAEYAVVAAEDGSRMGIEFRHVPFDVDATGAIQAASGMPYAQDDRIRYARYGR